LQDAADNDAIGQHVVVILAPLAAQAAGRSPFEDQIVLVHYRPAGRAGLIAFRPASVIFMRTTSAGRPPATICSGVAIARPAMHRSTSRGTGKPCASMIASVQPSGEAASNSSARRRSGLEAARRMLPNNGNWAATPCVSQLVICASPLHADDKSR